MTDKSICSSTANCSDDLFSDLTEGPSVEDPHCRRLLFCHYQTVFLSVFMVVFLILSISPCFAAEPELVKDIYIGGSLMYFPENLVSVNNTLFFRADNGPDGYELWKSDGTPTGTHIVKDINPGAGDSSPLALTNVNGTLFFRAEDGVNGNELWKSDGSDGGTVMVKDINPSPGGGSNPNDFADVNGVLFFSAKDGIHGYELWKSDGSDVGTVMVKDIVPGAGGSLPEVLAGGAALCFSEGVIAHMAVSYGNLMAARPEQPSSRILNQGRVVLIRKNWSLHTRRSFSRLRT